MYQVILSKEELQHLCRELSARLYFGENILKDADAEKLGVNLSKVRRRVNLQKRILKKLRKEFTSNGSNR